ncbi:hypothetical protein F0U59_00425 [Archangium gephyra]|nr:hypothetical protein F0U59_00425 [Archangium gephyra]
MTKRAMTELGAEFFGTSHQTRAMRSAIGEIAQANAEVDQDQTNGFKHFDGESFVPGKQRLVTLFDGVVLSLRAGDARGARRQLGQALHTLQDFHSHSNWLESGHAGALSALWRSGEPLPASAGAQTATCEDCEPVFLSDGSLFLDCGGNLLTPLLTSGYYGGENEVPATASKCRHGGPFDTGPGPSGGINKDTLHQLLSPHFRLHMEAADSAVEASRQFIRDLQARLTRSELELLFGVGPTLTLAIGPTGRLGPLLTLFQSQLSQLVDSRIGTGQEPLRYVLVPFTDASTGPLLVTHDPLELKRFLGTLLAAAGGGCSGPSMAAALQALGASGGGGELFLFAPRAASRDGHRVSQVSSLAWHQGTRIHAFLSDACGGAAGASLAPEYQRLASETGGQVFLLQPLEAASITHLIDATVRANTVELLSVADERGGSRAVFPVPVDSTLSRVTFSLSGSPSLRLTRPDGSPVLGVEPGVRRLQLSTGVLVTVLDPAPGVWTATLDPSGGYSLHVLGESPVGLDRFALVETAGRPGHQGYFALEGLPVLAGPSTVVAGLSGGISSARFELRDPAGALLQPLELTPAPGAPPLELTGTVELPSRPFTVYALGTLPGGEPWQRVLTRRFQSQTVRLFAPPSQRLVPGRSSYTFQVESSGAPATFRFTARDDRGFVTGVSPGSFTLGSGERRALTVHLEVPEDVAPGTSDTLLAMVESTAPTGARNFAVVTSVPDPEVTVDCGGARPGVATLWPPDHGFIPVGVEGVASSDGSPVRITIDRVLQSEAPGEGACPDVRGLGGSTVELRAERSGSGPGRLYQLRFTARTDTGGHCTGSVQVCVPHGKKGSCPTAPVAFDSHVCPGTKSPPGK